MPTKGDNIGSMKIDQHRGDDGESTSYLSSQIAFPFKCIPGTPITVTGKFYSIKKGKVCLEDPDNGKKKTCKVVIWGMDSIAFIVPKTSKSFPAKDYLLKAANKVGEDSTTFKVTVE
jgi:hypothetical protein